MNKKIKIPLLVLAVLVILFVLGYAIAPIRNAVSWRVGEVMIALRSWLNPPEDVDIAIQVQQTLDLQATLNAMRPSATLAPTRPQSTPLPPATATPQPTALPVSVRLDGVRYVSQHGYFNYCAPANLAMALSFYGWNGDLEELGSSIKPNPQDKNVMPYEMAAYARDVAGLGALERVGGSAELIKRFLAAGFPVLVEKGVLFNDLQNRKSWMGHYQVITGYDDAKGVFIAQDSYVKANLEEPYDQFITDWRSFNYTYLIIYRPEQESQVLALLGPDADETENFRNAFAFASNEVYGLEGVDQFFAWYNIGTSLVKLQDFAGAANAYDQAFTLYNTLPQDLASRPYRMLWYQTGPYFAYYYMGRYQDVIDLATNNSIAMVLDDKPALEETFYWRGMARYQIGEIDGAVEDMRAALKWHKDFGPALQALQTWGVTP